MLNIHSKCRCLVYVVIVLNNMQYYCLYQLLLPNLELQLTEFILCCCVLDWFTVDE